MVESTDIVPKWFIKSTDIIEVIVSVFNVFVLLINCYMKRLWSSAKVAIESFISPIVTAVMFQT